MIERLTTQFVDFYILQLMRHINSDLKKKRYQMPKKKLVVTMTTIDLTIELKFGQSRPK